MTPQKLAWKQKWRNLFSEVERRVDCWLERWGKIGMKYQKEEAFSAREGEEEIVKIVWAISWKGSESDRTWLTLLLGEENGRRFIVLRGKQIVPFSGVSIDRLHQKRNMETKWAEIDYYLGRLPMNLFLYAAAKELSTKLGCPAYVSYNGERLNVEIGKRWLSGIAFRLCDDGTFKWVLPDLNGGDKWHIGGSRGDDPMALLVEAVKAMALSLL
jgi:hypothetical protein